MTLANENVIQSSSPGAATETRELERSSDRSSNTTLITNTPESTKKTILFEDREDQVLARLRAEANDSIERAKELSKNNDRGYKAEILILAKIKEKELTALGQQWLINNICADITRIYEKEDIHIWPWVYRFLPQKYKNFDNNFLSTEQSSSQLPAAAGNQIEQSSSQIYIPPQSSTGAGISLTETLQTLVKNIPYAQTAELSDAISLTKKLNGGYKKRAEAEHVAIPPDEASSTMDQINDSKQEERESVTTDKPRPHGSLMYDVLEETIENFTDLRKRVFTFPPEILARDQEITESLKTLNYLLGSALDLKYGKSWLDWFKTEKFRDIYGKHAAAVMSFSMTNLCAECSDEKTREWVRMEPVYAFQYASYHCLRCQYQLDTVCPACNLAMKEIEKPIVSWECPECNSTHPVRRDLTREQVGDKSSIIVDAAIQVLEHIPYLMGFFSWYREWIEPMVSGRRSRLSGDLSDRA